MYTKNSEDSPFYGRFEYIEVEVLGPKLNLSPHTESASCHMLVIKYGQVMLHSKSAILPFKVRVYLLLKKIHLHRSYRP